MKTVMKVGLGVVLGCLVLIVGCGVLIGVGLNETQKESDEHAITPAQFREIRTGMTLAEVEDLVGVEPASSQELEVDTQELKGLGVDTTAHSGMTCRYYNRKGDLLSLYQLCFDGRDRLESKASY